jgi:SAM-dependent methyltransferase
MALMHLCLNAPDHEIARRSLENAIEQANGVERERLLEVQSLWRDTPDVFALIKAIIGTEPVPGGDAVARWAASFDAVAKISPAASVALYSLGREDLLERATREVVDFLRGERLLGRERCSLEIGCGIGRFLAAMAPELARVVGVDVSSNMLAQARQRCKGYTNVELFHGDGRRFGTFPSEGFDLILGVDSFPYLVAAGEDVVRSNVEEARRLLRPEGRLLIFNYSYRGDEEVDQRDVARLAFDTGLEVQRCGERPFQFWDGAIYDLARPE